MAIEVIVPGVPEPIVVEIGGLLGPTGPAPAGNGFVWVIDGVLQTPVVAGTTAGKLLVLGEGDTLTLDSTGADGVGIIVTAGGSTAGVFDSVDGEGLSVTSTNSNAASFVAGGSGSAFIGLSDSGTGAHVRTTSGTYHATFGDTGDDRSAIERVRGWLVWFFGAFTGRLKTADITNDRDWMLPDLSGTVGILRPFADSATANAAVSVGDAWYDTTLKKTRVRLS